MTIRAEFIVALAAFGLLVSSATPERAAAQASSEVPRTAGGKPDFNGIYEWPRALPGAATCRCSATIFDRKNFGMTEFVQKLNYQRALQGELSRTSGI